MVKKSAKQAVKDVLKIELEEQHSQELYYSICAFLMEKHELCYIDIIEFKYALLLDDYDQDLVDYLVMEYVLDKMKKQHGLILATLTYLVTSKS
ncbi:hypothetical protein [Pontibacter sp. SGAir0037]|uniref:hypothetical protein n=1 Tax=Pontibacter sp. SGAir0037 TaxID=2571030 RepID=UPI0010CD10EB|nr:hypothetical protein [Pontibacter sp. SGAir0037]QCR22729.1 hypothetical protein C1N53_10485 [Pontibacter sp. SGAir0037]